ncbi:MAG: hypothetical protein RBS39_02035 [Phycisphaerales bacterium]|jgi:hypothetical protein|nr:hypothetical protein [Phycisphaerales bacterium]
MNRHRLCVGLAVVALAGSAALATGPANQRVPWNPGGLNSTLDSVVHIRNAITPGGFRIGSGSVVCKKIVGGDMWVGVLTANHVARNGGRRNNQINFGDSTGGYAGTFGFNSGVAGSSTWQIQYPDNRIDMSYIAVNLGPNVAGAAQTLFNNLNPLSYMAFPTAGGMLDPDGVEITQVGYGLNGSWNGTNTAMVTSTPTFDGNKRFQNNSLLAATRDIDPNGTTGADTYDYNAVQFTMQAPAAAGFLRYEGISYGGDSGSPYLVSSMVSDTTDWNVGNNNFELFTDTIIAVHTLGDSNSTAGGNTPLGAYGAGVPLTAAHVAWLDRMCMIVPAPGGTLLFVGAGLFAARRRRG